MGKLNQFISGSEKLELQFNVPMDIAIERLQSRVKKSSLVSLTSEGMMGSVAKERTSIYRVNPMIRNSFKPVFTGRFSNEGGKTVLSGVLSLHGLVQAFLAVWFGFTAFFVLISSIIVVLSSGEAWFVPLIGVFMFCFGLGLLSLGKLLSQNDKQWLEKRIANAVNDDS